MSEQTQTYYATSAWSDPQNVASALSAAVGIFALPEVAAIIPLRYMPIVLAISSILSLILRTVFGVRPVANIKPGEVKPVRVETISATQPKEK